VNRGWATVTQRDEILHLLGLKCQTYFYTHRSLPIKSCNPCKHDACSTLGNSSTYSSYFPSPLPTITQYKSTFCYGGRYRAPVNLAQVNDFLCLLVKTCTFPAARREGLLEAQAWHSKDQTRFRARIVQPGAEGMKQYTTNGPELD